MSNAVMTAAEQQRQLGAAQLATQIRGSAAQLQALGRELLVKAPMSPIVPLVQKMAAEAEEQACACENLAAEFPGPLSKKELNGYTRLARSMLVWRTFFGTGSIQEIVEAMGNPLNSYNKMRLLDLGKTRDGKTFGLTAGQTLTEYHTPFENDGQLGAGRHGEIYGFRVKLRNADGSAVSSPNLQILEEAKLSYVEAGATRTIGYFGDLIVPTSEGREDDQFGGGLVLPRVLTTVRGGQTRDGYAILEFPNSAAKLTSRIKVTWEAIGPYYERSVGTAPS